MADKSDRIMIFIDGSNLYHSLKGHFKRTDVDIGKFCKKLLDKRRLVRIYYYNAEVGRKQEPERTAAPHPRGYLDYGPRRDRVSYGVLASPFAFVRAPSWIFALLRAFPLVLLGLL